MASKPIAADLTGAEARPHVLRIRPSSGWRALDLAELWRYRELLGFLAMRDIKVRYKQTILGIAWAVIQPLFTMIIFTVIFGRFAKLPSDGMPYPLFTLIALLPWQLFAHALTVSSNSLVAEQQLITKVYFPRLIIPFASVLSGLADFAITFVLVLLLMTYYQVALSWTLLAVPLFVLLAIATALSVGIWMATLNVQFRDVRYVIPFLTQMWLFATPVAYSSTLVPKVYRPLYGLNPMTGVVEGFRWALVGKADPPGVILAISVLAVAVLLVSGAFYFRRMEKNFADFV